MAKNTGRGEQSDNRDGTSGASHRRGRGPALGAVNTGGRDAGSIGQAARSEFDSLNNPAAGGFGYDATTPDNALRPGGKGEDQSNAQPKVQKACPPNQNPGSDYRSPENEVHIRHGRRPAA